MGIWDRVGMELVNTRMGKETAKSEKLQKVVLGIWSLDLRGNLETEFIHQL